MEVWRITSNLDNRSRENDHPHQSEGIDDGDDEQQVADDPDGQVDSQDDPAYNLVVRSIAKEILEKERVRLSYQIVTPGGSHMNVVLDKSAEQVEQKSDEEVHVCS